MDCDFKAARLLLQELCFYQAPDFVFTLLLHYITILNLGSGEGEAQRGVVSTLERYVLRVLRAQNSSYPMTYGFKFINKKRFNPTK